ncbi:MAG: adaptor protein MecA [Lachnospiraceae bacterium]|nr:adaptor protein MecA [Lachnospiraceae bacterium]
MKLEKLNDNQIRCTLSKSDLDKRELRLSELAYGSPKARALFRDMIQQASVELDFDAENIPLMIEAIPISSDCLVLVVTKVEDPEELDTRFSRFSNPAIEEEDLNDLSFASPDSFDDLEEEDYESDVISFSDNSSEKPLPFGEVPDPEDSELPIDSALDLIAPFTKAIAQAKKEVLRKQQEASNKKTRIQIYSFSNLDTITVLSSFLQPFYKGESRLYKDISSNLYYLFLFRDEEHPDTFKRACHIAADYGTLVPSSYSTLSYFEEHHCEIFRENALEMLSQLI